MALIETVARSKADPAQLQLRSMWAKRSLDIVAGVPLCLLAIPVIVVLAVVLTAQLRSNPFFVHHRIGRGGRLMPIPKLRTLAPCTDPYADKTKVTLRPPTGLAQALRRLHLDELPQLFLVPVGRMSLVGPRPRMAIEAEQHGDFGYEAMRTSVHQGCTGLWQISAGNGKRVSDHPEYDEFYVLQHTMRLDLWILWRTVIQTLGAPPVSFADVPRWTLRRPDLLVETAAA